MNGIANERTKTDSLKIICLSEIDGHIELAVFDDFNPPRISISDSCAVFEFIKNNQDSLFKGYWEERQKTKNLLKAKKYQSNAIEILSFTIKKPWYSRKQGFHYIIHDKIYNQYGINLEKDPWYNKIRFIMDSLIEISKR